MACLLKLEQQVDPSCLISCISSDWTQLQPQNSMDGFQYYGVILQENGQPSLPSAAFIELAHAAGCLISKGRPVLSSILFGHPDQSGWGHSLAVVCNLETGAIQISDEEPSSLRLGCFLTMQHEKV